MYSWIVFLCGVTLGQVTRILRVIVHGRQESIREDVSFPAELFAKIQPVFGEGLLDHEQTLVDQVSIYFQETRDRSG